jgi:toxin FitB
VRTFGELRRGVEKLPESKRREKLRYWLEHELPAWFGDRLLPVDAALADPWGRLQATAECTLPAIDSLLAAARFKSSP